MNKHMREGYSTGRFGYIRSSYDPRDYIYGASVVPATLPRSATALMQYLPQWQGQQGAGCVGWSSQGLCATVWNSVGVRQPMLSGAYAYDWARVSSGYWPGDYGAMPRGGMDCLLNHGCAELAAWNSISVLPDAAAEANAAPRRVKSYASLPYHDIATQVLQMKTAILAGHPLLMAGTIYRNFDIVDAEGVIPLPGNAAYWGGHAWFAVAYDDSKGATGCFFIQGSHGPLAWSGGGNAGAWLPYEYVYWANEVYLVTVDTPPPLPEPVPTPTLSKDDCIARFRALLNALENNSMDKTTFIAQARSLLTSYESGSDPVPTPVPGGPIAFVKTDLTTQGNWKGVYGRDGYLLVKDHTSLPAYATATPTGKGDWEWTQPGQADTDPRALQRVGVGGRVAACWYGQAFNVAVAFNDTSAHQVALYVIDWDTHERRAKIEVLDASGAVVDTQQLATDYNGGRYLVWKVTGRCTFRFTSLAGWNACVSGIFFDPAG